MKLKTTLVKDECGHVLVDYSDGSEVDYDAIAAHALMQALDENRPYGYDHIILRKRASEIMREWGFEDEESE